MKELPLFYQVKVEGKPEQNLSIHAQNLPALTGAAPSQFGGPGDQWSPEDLLMASIASCFVLSFRAIAQASKLAWLAVECESKGELNKMDRKMRFTKVLTKAKLIIPATESVEKAETLLIKAEQTCLISNSLSCESHLDCEIVLAPQ